MEDDLEYYLFFLDAKSLFEAWEIQVAKNGLLNFANFYFNYGNEINEKGLKLSGREFEPLFSTRFNQMRVTNELEKEFFRVESNMEEYAMKISTVQQLIEHQIKNSR